LSNVERRAFKQAVFAVRDEHGALDIVQDAMLKLAEKYSGRPVEEFPMLFQRILQNAIRDYFRRQKVRTLWTTILSSFTLEEDADPLELLDTRETLPAEGPQEMLERSQVISHVEQAIESLPARQRQAFLLRYWEELNVAETASAMGCSEGSVKTHCSRATHAIAAFLKSRGIEL
jgi:RNA polymerase sigma-70 factor (ECF subfamily)